VISPSQRPLPTQVNTTYKHKKQTSMTRVRFEPATPATERPQTYALDRAATGIDIKSLYVHKNMNTIVCVMFLCRIVGGNNYIILYSSSHNSVTKLTSNRCVIEHWVVWRQIGNYMICRVSSEEHPAIVYRCSTPVTLACTTPAQGVSISINRRWKIRISSSVSQTVEYDWVTEQIAVD
jgi:hypothetical protein